MPYELDGYFSFGEHVLGRKNATTNFLNIKSRITSYFIRNITRLLERPVSLLRQTTGQYISMFIRISSKLFGTKTSEYTKIIAQIIYILLVSFFIIITALLLL